MYLHVNLSKNRTHMYTAGTRHRRSCMSDFFFLGYNRPALRSGKNAGLFPAATGCNRNRSLQRGYSRGQTKTTILVIIIWGPCTTLDSTFYCRNMEIRTQRFDLYEPIFQNRWNEKFYPKNIGQTLNGPLKSWKIAQSTPFSTLHLILKLRGSSEGLFLQKKMILNQGSSHPYDP